MSEVANGDSRRRRASGLILRLADRRVIGVAGDLGALTTAPVAYVTVRSTFDLGRAPSNATDHEGSSRLSV
jgi:hypothetical protein